MIKFSIIIPVYNRPDEVKELLGSLANQTQKNFEVLLIEDGSTNKCELVAEEFKSLLEIKYFIKENTGRSYTRNYGMERASGNYFILFDSDCIIPSHYFETLNDELTSNYTDAFGGPDNANDTFTSMQKAINYSMTSFFTTGGIRGGKEAMGKFHPRSFNMGLSREVYEKVGGFFNMFGEDIDLSIRIIKAGFKTRLIKNVFVYHKRRVDLKKFFKQVYTFGLARITLFKKYPDSLKLVHALPSLMVLLGLTLVFLSVFLCYWLGFPIVIYLLLIFSDSLVLNKSLSIALLSVVTSIIQICGYGSGFIIAFIRKVILRQKDSDDFIQRFYK